MTSQEQKLVIAELVLQRRNLKQRLACLKAKLGGWESDFRNLSSALSHVAGGTLRLDQKGEEENMFVVAAGDHSKAVRPLITQIDHRDGISYPDFEEISQTLVDLHQAQTDMGNVEIQLKDCGVD